MAMLFQRPFNVKIHAYIAVLTLSKTGWDRLQVTPGDPEIGIMRAKKMSE